jgi:hypothetical protein
VKIFDHDFHVRQVVFDRGFQVAQADGLQPHVGVVEISNRRLEEEKFHSVERF